MTHIVTVELDRSVLNLNPALPIMLRYQLRESAKAAGLCADLVIVSRPEPGFEVYVGAPSAPGVDNADTRKLVGLAEDALSSLLIDAAVWLEAEMFAAEQS